MILPQMNTDIHSILSVFIRVNPWRNLLLNLYVLTQTYPNARGFNREPGQNHRHHHHRDPQYPAFRPFFRLAERLMLRFVALVSLFVCLYVTTLLNALAQETVDEDEVVRVNTDLLLFPVRIRDKKGQAVAGLTEQDLLLKDQDQVTTGLYFSPGADRVALMFALDQSGSLRQIISQQQEAALALFSRFGERSSVAVLRFSNTASLVSSVHKRSRRRARSI